MCTLQAASMMVNSKQNIAIKSKIRYMCDYLSWSLKCGTQVIQLISVRPMTIKEN